MSFLLAPSNFEIQLQRAGDRYELTRSDSHQLGRFRLPSGFLASGVPIDAIEDEAGQPLEFRLDPASESLFIPQDIALWSGDLAVFWLECCGQGRFRLIVELAEVAEEPKTITTDQGIEIQLDVADQEVLGDAFYRSANQAEVELSLRATRLATHSGFETLLCLPLVREMELLEHQTKTAKTVLSRFRGRALLCDEVGLGKTIEAGLVLSELSIRGLASSVLILVPPSLVEQWQGELSRKFSLLFTAHDAAEFKDAGPAAWQEFDRIIASIHTAKREPHRSKILDRKWDLIIVDEAHHLRNRNTQQWRFVSQIDKQFIMLLTATPVQNHLEELYNLVTLLEPGLLRTARQFQRQFVDRRDKLTPRNIDQLHELLREVMVRNRRSTTGLQFTRRFARTDRIQPDPAEQDFYRAVSSFVRHHLSLGKEERSQRCGLNRMALISLQMALGSSAAAAAATLKKMSENTRLPTDLRKRIAELATSGLQVTAVAKISRLLDLLEEFSDKMVIFTQFRATQDLLERRLFESGHDVAIFHGGLTRLAKEAAIQRFRGPARILLATESGSEGRNLQFANAICNFDLPWNPMKIEQRVGRLSRIGQTRDVHVFNLVAAGTIEESVLRLLEAKLNMFELVIGEIDMVLGNLDEEREFQDVVVDLWSESADDEEFVRRIDELGDRLLAAKQAYFEQRDHDDRLFGDRFAPDR